MLLIIIEKMVIMQKKIKVVKLILLKKFDAILKDINNNGKTTKLMSVESHNNNNINLHSLIRKLLNAEETFLKKGHRFDEAFVFDEIDNKHNKCNEYKTSTSNKIKTKKLRC